MTKLLLNTRGKETLKEIREDIRHFGRSTLCPCWRKSFDYNRMVGELPKHDCEICRKLLPDLYHRYKTAISTGRIIMDCPCNHYSKSHLIKLINKILKEEVEI